MVWRKGCEFTVLRVTTALRRGSTVYQVPPHLSHCMMKTIATRQRPCRPHVDRHVLLPWNCSRAALLFFHAIFRGRLVPHKGLAPTRVSCASFALHVSSVMTCTAQFLQFLSVSLMWQILLEQLEKICIETPGSFSSALETIT